MSEATATTTQSNGTALVPAKRSGNALTADGYRFQNLDEVWRFAQQASRSGIVPSNYRDNPAAILTAIQMGSEIGITPMTSLRSIAVINGRPSLYGPAAKALVLNSGLCEEFEEWYELDGKHVPRPTPEQYHKEGFTAVCKTKRKGHKHPKETSFSVADAKEAKLWQKRGSNGQDTPWITAPLRMLMFRARGFNLQDQFPDVLQGIYSSIEEAQDIEGDYTVVDAMASPAAANTPPTGTFAAEDATVEPATETKPEDEKAAKQAEAERQIDKSVGEASGTKPKKGKGKAAGGESAAQPAQAEPPAQANPAEAPKAAEPTPPPQANPSAEWLAELEKEFHSMCEAITNAKTHDDLKPLQGSYAKRSAEIKKDPEKAKHPQCIEFMRELALKWYSKRILVCANLIECQQVAPFLTNPKLKEAVGEEYLAKLTKVYDTHYKELGKKPKNAEPDDMMFGGDAPPSSGPYESGQ